MISILVRDGQRSELADPAWYSLAEASSACANSTARLCTK